jgi:hypothetical protein
MPRELVAVTGCADGRVRRGPSGRSVKESAAREVLPAAVHDYYPGGAEDELTLRANPAAYGELFLRPRVLTDVSPVDPSVHLMADRLASPVLLAPRAFQRLARPEEELARSPDGEGSGSKPSSSGSWIPRWTGPPWSGSGA